MKKNKGLLYQRAEELFQKALKNHWSGYTYSDYRLSELGHGREETRFYQMLSNVQEELDPEEKWSKLNSVGRVDYLRTEKDGKTTLERRYYISSLQNNAELLAQSIREHWCVENKLNWVLDVQCKFTKRPSDIFIKIEVGRLANFNEDDSRIRKDNALFNLAIIRQIALNLLNQEKTVKNGVKNKRKRAGWDNDYLLKVLVG